MSNIQKFLDLLTVSNLTKVLAFISVVGYIVFMTMAFLHTTISIFKDIF